MHNSITNQKEDFLEWIEKLVDMNYKKYMNHPIHKANNYRFDGDEEQIRQDSYIEVKIEFNYILDKIELFSIEEITNELEEKLKNHTNCFGDITTRIRNGVYNVTHISTYGLYSKILHTIKTHQKLVSQAEYVLMMYYLIKGKQIQLSDDYYKGDELNKSKLYKLISLLFHREPTKNILYDNIYSKHIPNIFNRNEMFYKRKATIKSLEKLCLIFEKQGMAKITELIEDDIFNFQ